MPRGLDRLPAVMRLVVGVVLQSLLVLAATVITMRMQGNTQDTHHQPDAITSGGQHQSLAEKRDTKNVRQKIMSSTTIDVLLFFLSFVGITAFHGALWFTK